MLISYSVVLMKPKLPHQGQRGGGGAGFGDYTEQKEQQQYYDSTFEQHIHQFIRRKSFIL